ncbi:expressed unknown protein [Seminavis robusta]|uniref:Uncharacterized protein n=1 Tax=Seminavis robusta TaxID=568900 RepID=A0A9N8HDC7_9STRA|nr:expressed unknown protein [Seminavis robusta]|eukprot:Sro254_g100060.1 n/a (161) ;mRNA; f:7446-7928
MVGFLVSTGVSLMMNGMCCAYQMHGEKELRQAMRSDIREEWRQQREIEANAISQFEKEAERLRFESLEQRHMLLEFLKRQQQGENEERSEPTTTIDACRSSSSSSSSSRQQRRAACCSQSRASCARDRQSRSGKWTQPSLFDDDGEDWEEEESSDNPQEA